MDQNWICFRPLPWNRGGSELGMYQSSALELTFADDISNKFTLTNSIRKKAYSVLS